MAREVFSAAPKREQSREDRLTFDMEDVNRLVNSGRRVASTALFAGALGVGVSAAFFISPRLSNVHPSSALTTLDMHHDLNPRGDFFEVLNSAFDLQDTAVTAAVLLMSWLVMSQLFGASRRLKHDADAEDRFNKELEKERRQNPFR